jgi:ribose-phosphate pyrophosphokinase
MIKVKNLTNGHECPNIKPTIFPDKTSQVWKLPEEVLGSNDPLAPRSEYKVTWLFESEAEVIQLIQLSYLLYNHGKVVELFIPYFPYARQDKVISNETTFAQRAIIELLDIYFDCGINVFDLHNPSVCETHFVNNIAPEKFILKSLISSQADIVCYPDAGAAKRYNLPVASVVADKVRDQSTGQILGHSLQETKHDLKNKKVLIVDDLIDAGGTFISICKILKQAGAQEVNLYVSHGIFSKGVHILREAGINRIFTTNSFIGSDPLSKIMCTVYEVEE